LNNCPNTTAAYSDFYNNENGSFCNPPAGMRIIITVNANGDSCDIYHNIFLAPLFYSTIGDSAFFLTANSPSIDAGDPTIHLDPDRTIADIGAFYFDQTPPQVIDDLTITIEGDNVVLQWSPFTGAISYNIYRSETPYFEIIGLTPIGSVTQPEYTDAGALENGVFFYRVTAVSAGTEDKPTYA